MKLLSLIGASTMFTLGCMSQRSAPPAQLAMARVESPTQLDGGTLYKQAVAYETLGDVDQATRAYRAAEAAFYETPRKALATYGEANAYARVGGCEQARAAYERYADMVRSDDPGSADMALAYAQQCRQAAVIDPVLSNMAALVIHRDYAQALSLSQTDHAPASGWLEYERGAALAGLGRTHEAVQAFSRAESQLATAGDLRGRSLATYGKARALTDAFRCADAKRAYDDYAALVRVADPAAAAMATAYSATCP